MCQYKDWVDSAQDSDFWRATVNMALNLRMSQDMELILKKKTRSRKNKSTIY